MQTRSKIKTASPTLKRVGVFMTDHHMGDFILSIPTIERIAAYFEGGIDLYVAAPHASLARLIPNVNRVTPYQHDKKTRKSPKQFLSFLGMILQLPFKRYQAAYFIRARITESTFAVLTLSPRRIATDSCARTFVYNWLVPEPTNEKHEARKMAAVLQTIGDDRPIGAARLAATGADAKIISATLEANHVAEGEKLIVIHPSAGLAHRCWPKDRFAFVADAMIECGWRVCFIGAPSEKDFVAEIKGLMQHPAGAFFFAHKLTVLLALFERADLLFSNESGPTHLAATTDIPIVTIFGPTNPEQWRPTREDNLTLLSKKGLCQCDDPRFCDVDWPCIKEITVEEALAAIEAYV